MKLSILTMLTNPDQRQDKWQEAIKCYLDLADEVVIVNGGNKPTEELRNNFNPKIVWIDLPWPYEWNWVELPRHLNEGLKYCTGDWIIKLDIDQLIHEKDFIDLRDSLQFCPAELEVATMQKMGFVCKKKYYQKGEQPVCFRNRPYIKFGKNIEQETDLCFPVDIRGINKFDFVDGIKVYAGGTLPRYRTRIKYWNYDYFFKTQEFTRKEFWRFARAYHRYFKDWHFGSSEEDAFKTFLEMQSNRYHRSPYEYKLEDHPKYIREAVENLKPEQFGWDGWGLI